MYAGQTYQVSNRGRREQSVYTYTLCNPYPICMHRRLVRKHARTRFCLSAGDGSDHDISSDSNSEDTSNSTREASRARRMRTARRHACAHATLQGCRARRPPPRPSGPVGGGFSGVPPKWRQAASYSGGVVSFDRCAFPSCCVLCLSEAQDAYLPTSIAVRANATRAMTTVENYNSSR